MESLFLMNYNRCEENISVFKKISVLLKKIQWQDDRFSVKGLNTSRNRAR